MSAASSSDRMPRLAKVLADRDLDVFFCTTAVTMGYLAGLHEEGGERLLVLALNKDGRYRLICPSLARTQAERSGIADIQTWNDGQDPMALIRQLASDWGFNTAAVDDEMRSSILLAMQRTLPGVSFVAGQPVLSDLMTKKDESELDALRRAGRVADEAYEAVRPRLKAGMTEYQVNEMLVEAMAVPGSRPTFCIIATGRNGAEPHHMTDRTVIQDGDVIIMDFGCEVDGYMSDITRVACIGESTEEHRKVYDTVYKAHMAARAAIRPGVKAEDIDSAARQVIEEAGYGELFIHRTGHGLGRRIHEEPYICTGNDVTLEVGNVFSIEPGIYLPGRFGVRIENIVAVTEDGHESMNAEPSPTLVSV